MSSRSQKSDRGQFSGLLRVRSERPSHYRTTEKQCEFPPPHSMTSSAIETTPGGT